MSNRISLILGGAGTGKTTIIRAILQLAGFPEWYQTLSCAPTGKAVRNLAAHGILPARTIHSAMGIKTADDDDVSLVSWRNIRLVNIDELSMVTTHHLAMLRGPVTVSIFFEGEEDGWLVSMDASGRKTYSAFLSDPALQDAFYMERCNQTTVLAVPADLDYRVEWTAESGGTVECLQTLVSVHDSARYGCGVSGKIQARPGDSGIALRQADGRNMLPDGFTETTYDARKLAEFMGIASLGVNWRYALMALCAVIALIICVCLCVAAARLMETKKRFRFVTWAALCLLGIAALETETAYWFFADRPLIRVLWKCVVAACLLFLFFQTKSARTGLGKTYFPAVLPLADFH